MLYFTSFGFGFVSMFFKDRISKTILNMLMGTSILHHAKSRDQYRGKRILTAIDKTLAHLVTIAAIIKGIRHFKKANAIQNAMHVAIATYIINIYHIAKFCHRPPPHGDVFHGTLHLAAFIGLASVASLTSKPR